MREEMNFVVDGLMQEGPEGAALCAARCDGCGSVYFPRPAGCRNPACNETSLSEALLEGRGILYSYTIQRYEPPPLFRMDAWAPYALGLVDLPENIRVMGMLTGFDLDEIRLGEPVRLVSECLFTDPERGRVMTYKFAPVTTEEVSL